MSFCIVWTNECTPAYRDSLFLLIVKSSQTKCIIIIAEATVTEF